MKPWIFDAGAANLSQLEIGHFTPISNQAVKGFLSPRNTDKTVLVGPKGYGKTLLLLKKAADLRKQYSVDQAHIHPSNAARTVEFMRLDGISQKVTDWKWSERFANHQAWSDVWTYAIGFTVCHNEGRRVGASGNFVEVANEIERLFKDAPNRKQPLASDDSPASSRGKSHVRRKNEKPQEISTVRNFISLMLQNWEFSAEEYSALYTQTVQPALDDLKHLHMLFLDSPDEALNWDQEESAENQAEGTEVDLWSCYPEHWVNFNVGLIDAIRRMQQMYANIRIFTSMRAEALNSVRAAVGIQYEDLCIRLSYNKLELRQIFEKNIELMANDDEHREKLVNQRLSDHLIKDFIGIDKGLHKPTGIFEDIFDVILRHTRWTPRDLMLVGRNIMTDTTVDERKACTPENFDRIRDTIDVCSRKFLHNHRGASIPQWQHKLDDVIKVFQTNIVHDLSLRWISPISNRETALGCPFDYLYSQGLLGWIGAASAGSAPAIQFLEGQEIATTGTLLPQARWYALHPIFYGWLRDTHGTDYESQKGYKSSSRAIVGNGHLIEKPRAIRVFCKKNDFQITITGSRMLEITKTDGIAAIVLLALVAHVAHHKTLIFDKESLQPTIESLKGKDFFLREPDWQAVFSGSTDETKKINNWLAESFFQKSSNSSTNERKQSQNVKKARNLYPIRLRYQKSKLTLDGLSPEEIEFVHVS